MSQNPISIVNNKRLSMMSSMLLSTPSPPFIESKERENFKLCRVNPYGAYLPPSPSDIGRYEFWNDNEDVDDFSLPASYLATPNKTRSKHSSRAFARLETTNEDNNRTSTKLSQKTIVEPPKTEENLVLQLEDTVVPPMSPSCSTSTEESDIDDLNQENPTTVIYKQPPVLQKRLTRDFDSYVSEFIRNSELNTRKAKKPQTSSVFKSFF
jgi:hypothetical protein